MCVCVERESVCVLKGSEMGRDKREKCPVEISWLSLTKPCDFDICGFGRISSTIFLDFLPILLILDLQLLAPNIPEDLTHWKVIFRELEGTVIELEEYEGDNNDGGDE